MKDITIFSYRNGARGPQALFLALVFSLFFSTGLYAVGYCCHSTVYDTAEQMTKNCGSLDDTHAPQNVYIQDGKVAFVDFPYVRKCDRHPRGQYKLWPKENGLCDGFSDKVINMQRADPVADQKGQCWRWQCKSAYPVMGAGGKCMTRQENCESLGLRYSNNMCVANWCAGWESGFNASLHREWKVGTCYQYRCQAGKYFAGSDRTTCRMSNPSQGEVGGNYGNDDSNGAGNTVDANNWTFVQCGADQYVDKVNNRWQCTPRLSVDDARIKSCWRCKGDAALKQCLKTGISDVADCYDPATIEAAARAAGQAASQMMQSVSNIF